MQCLDLRSEQYQDDVAHFPTVALSQVRPIAPGTGMGEGSGVRRTAYGVSWSQKGRRWNMTCENVVYADIEQTEFGTLSPAPVRS